MPVRRGRGGEGRGGEGRGGEGEGRGGEGWRGEGRGGGGEGRGGEGRGGEGRGGKGRGGREGDGREGEGRGGVERGGEGRGGEGRGGEGRTKERNEESMAGEYGLPCKHVLMFACLPAPVQADLTCWTVRLSIDSLWRLVLGGFVLRVLHSTSRLHPLLPAPWARGETSKGRRGEEEVPEQRPAVPVSSHSLQTVSEPPHAHNPIHSECVYHHGYSISLSTPGSTSRLKEQFLSTGLLLHPRGHKRLDHLQTSTQQDGNCKQLRSTYVCVYICTYLRTFILAGTPHSCQAQVTRMPIRFLLFTGH